MIFIPEQPDEASWKEREVTTYFKFSRVENRLEVEQSWYCDGRGEGGKEVMFRAGATVSPALEKGEGVGGYVRNMTAPGVVVRVREGRRVIKGEGGVTGTVVMLDGEGI